MQAIFPMKYLRITTGYNELSHVGTLALDNAGKDAGIDDVYAPFDCVVTKVWPNGNSVWFQSTSEVEQADGTKGFVVLMLTHCNDIARLPVGATFKQGAQIYREGTAGNASGNHVHMEVGRGKFHGSGWRQLANGTWTINDAAKFEDVFFLNGTEVINGRGYAWKELKKVDDTISKENIMYFLLAFSGQKKVAQSEIDLWFNKGKGFKATMLEMSSWYFGRNETFNVYKPAAEKKMKEQADLIKTLQLAPPVSNDSEAVKQIEAIKAIVNPKN